MLRLSRKGSSDGIFRWKSEEAICKKVGSGIAER